MPKYILPWIVVLTLIGAMAFAWVARRYRPTPHAVAAEAQAEVAP